MRLCFLSRRYFPAISGMSVYAMNLLRELVAAGHDVTLISQYRADAAGSSIYGGGPPPPVPGVKVIGLESIGEARAANGHPADFEGDIQRLVDAVLAEHAHAPFELLHAQYGYPTGLAALEAGRRLQLPVVASIQGGDGHWVGLCCHTHRNAMRAVLLHASAVLIGSASFAQEVVGNHGVSSDIFTIVPGATDVARFVPRDNAALGTLRSPPVLLYHGRVDRRKGVIELLEAAALLVASGRSLGIVVSGIGPDVQAARDRAAELGLAGCVQFTGHVGYDEAPLSYHQGDIFVSPTYSEGFSNTILEAMASGLPIVSTRVVGVVDCLKHERDALLVEAMDAVGLADAIARLLDDAPLRHRLASRALDDVRRLYSWHAVGEQIMNAYARVVGRPVSSAWLDSCEMRERTVENADLSCRFRLSPHLL